MKNKRVFEEKVQKPVPSEAPRGYRIHNMTESILPVPIYDATGKTVFLNLRIQGRGGEAPPTIRPEQVTDRMRELVRRRMLRLEKVK